MQTAVITKYSITVRFHDALYNQNIEYGDFCYSVHYYLGKLVPASLKDKGLGGGIIASFVCSGCQNEINYEAAK